MATMKIKRNSSSVILFFIIGLKATSLMAQELDSPALNGTVANDDEMYSSTTDIPKTSSSNSDDSVDSRFSTKELNSGTSGMIAIFTMIWLICLFCIVLLGLGKYRNQRTVLPTRANEQKSSKETRESRRKKLAHNFQILTIEEQDVRSLMLDKHSVSSKKEEGDDDESHVTVTDHSSDGDEEKDYLEECEEGSCKRALVDQFLSYRKNRKIENAECSICLEFYKTGDTICVSKSHKCDHVFHSKCVSLWLSKHNFCPLCRMDLMRTDIDDKDEAHPEKQ